MLRLVELALFLSPFAVFAVWRLMAAEGGPSVAVLAAAAVLVAVLVGGLIWLSHDRTLPPGTGYAPARLEDGRIVSGHAVPR